MVITSLLDNTSTGRPRPRFITTRSSLRTSHTIFFKKDRIDSVIVHHCDEASCASRCCNPFQILTRLPVYTDSTYRLESYDWRTEEARLNTLLPQYRTTIKLSSPRNPDTVQTLRVHFVHKRSTHQNAIPLLFCHTWPSSFIEVQKIIDALTDPQSLPSFGNGAQQAFHVVAPSIPGFGFSDASSVEAFGLEDTADTFAKLMHRLGYDRYVTHGSGWYACL